MNEFKYDTTTYVRSQGDWIIGGLSTTTRIDGLNDRHKMGYELVTTVYDSVEDVLIDTFRLKTKV